MGRKNNNGSLIALALHSRWPVAAIISGGILFLGFVVAPVIARSNPILTMILNAFRPVIWVAAVLFGLVALVKWVSSLGVIPLPQESSAPPWRRPYPPPRSTPSPRPNTSSRQEPTFTTTPPPPPKEWSVELLQEIEWKRFEDLCQKFYEAKGISAACTPLGPDGGVDIRLFQDDSGQATAIVQCKAWGDSFVGVKPIRELLGVMVHEKVGKAFFMTTGRYSDEAKAFAAANRITLIDGTMFVAMIKRLPEPAQKSLLRFATAGDYNVPSCPTCGTKMRLVPGKEGKRDFWGCSNFPKCRQKLGARRGTANRPTAIYQ